jgi:hypothetical protein
LNGRADARVGGVFGDLAAEMRAAKTASEAEPGSGFELIFEEERFHVAGGLGTFGEIVAGAIVGVKSEEGVVLLSEGVEAGAENVFASAPGHSGLAAFVVGGAIIGSRGNVVGSALVDGAIEMIKGRQDGEPFGIKSVDPGACDAKKSCSRWRSL